MAKKNQNPTSPISEGYPVSNHVDGDNVSKIANKPGYMDINKGHTEWKNSQTGECMDPPEWAGDRD